MIGLTVGVATAEDTSDLRRRVLRPSWPPGSRMPADDVSGAVHFAAREGSEVVGAALLVPSADGRSWRLRGMATEPARRGQGIGRAVVRALLEHVARDGGGLVWCNARVSAVPFYARCGFTACGEPFVTAETGVPHIVMSRDAPPG